MIISFEGLDGVGKTTQAHRLTEWLRKHHYPTQLFREPGSTPAGEAIRELLLHGPQALQPLSEFLLFATARTELMATQVIPFHETGGIAIFDRFIDSSLAYQGYGLGLPLDFINTVNRRACQDHIPAVTFWIDGPVYATSQEKDVIETRSTAFFSAVHHGYATLAAQYPHRIAHIDGSADPDTVFQSIITRLHLDHSD